MAATPEQAYTDKLRQVESELSAVSGELDGTNLLLAEERETNAHLRRQLTELTARVSKLDVDMHTANALLISRTDSLRATERAYNYEVEAARAARAERRAWEAEAMTLRATLASVNEELARNSEALHVMLDELKKLAGVGKHA